MPDIRLITEALSPEDKATYNIYRTKLRSAYLQALVQIVGINAHNEADDAFLDFIDIKVAILFDRAGVFDAAYGKLDRVLLKDVSDKAAMELKKIEEKTKMPVVVGVTMDTSKLPQNGWN